MLLLFSCNNITSRELKSTQVIVKIVHINMNTPVKEVFGEQVISMLVKEKMITEYIKNNDEKYIT